MKLRVLATVAALGVGASLWGGHHDQQQPQHSVQHTDVHRTTATVMEVLDGDTVRAQDDTGHPLGRVRLLGIDAPEIAHHDQPGQCWGQEAKQQLLDLAPVGTTVELVVDDGQPDVDVYGRLLRYLDTAHGDVSTQLLEAGAARIYDTRPDLKRSRVHEAAQGAARTHQVGMWGACP